MHALPATKRRVQLAIEIGDGAARTVEIDRDAIVIGRSRDCDLVLEADGVSRKHARITRTGENAFNLVDLGAKNGTYLNGARVDLAALHHGDRIQIGAAVLRLVHVSLEPAPVAEVAANAAAAKLSSRELEVALGVADGLTNAEIAERLGISRRTVATHLERIFERLDIHSRAALAHRIARERPSG